MPSLCVFVLLFGHNYVGSLSCKCAPRQHESMLGLFLVRSFNGFGEDLRRLWVAEASKSRPRQGGEGKARRGEPKRREAKATRRETKVNQAAHRQPGKVYLSLKGATLLATSQENFGSRVPSDSKCPRPPGTARNRDRDRARDRDRDRDRVQGCGGGAGVLWREGGVIMIMDWN